jgi:hypothetical protein
MIYEMTRPNSISPLSTYHRPTDERGGRNEWEKKGRKGVCGSQYAEQTMRNRSECLNDFCGRTACGIRVSRYWVGVNIFFQSIGRNGPIFIWKFTAGLLKIHGHKMHVTGHGTHWRPFDFCLPTKAVKSQRRRTSVANGAGSS